MKSSDIRKLSLLLLILILAFVVTVTLHAGSHNKSFILPALFVCWVSSPFIFVLLKVSMVVKKPYVDSYLSKNQNLSTKYDIELIPNRNIPAKAIVSSGTERQHKALYFFGFFFALFSLISYSETLIFVNAKPAFIFLITPIIS